MLLYQNSGKNLKERTANNSFETGKDQIFTNKSNMKNYFANELKREII